MNHQFDRITRSLSQAFREVGIGFATLTLIGLLSLPALAQNDPITPPPGLVAWWPGDGNAKDIVGDNPSWDGVLMNGATANAAGLVGRAFEFDGVSSYVRLPNLVRAQPEGTVECWFKLNTWDWSGARDGRYLWSNAAYLPDTGFSFDGINLGCHAGYTGTGELIFGVEDAIDWRWALSGVTPETNVWYHVAGTWGSDGVRIYINGLLRGSNPYTGPAPGWVQHSLLGCSSWPNTFTDGVIDEFSLYNRALAPDEIAAIYAAGSAGKLKPTPQLNIGSAGGVILVWWPASALEFGLETASDLGTGQNWTLWNGPVLVIGDQNVVAANANTERRFFRLRKL